MKRDITGKFALKNEEHRLVRSLRLTDSTWESLGVAAQSLEITRADLLEQLVRTNAHFLPSNTPIGDNLVPSNTRKREEIGGTEAVKHGIKENATPVEQVVFRIEDLEVLCAQVLKELKLGKQAPGYRAAQKVLFPLAQSGSSPRNFQVMIPLFRFHRYTTNFLTQQLEKLWCDSIPPRSMRDVLNSLKHSFLSPVVNRMNSHA